MAREAKADNKSVMLAPNKQVPFDHKHVVYPLYGSWKFDGHRTFVRAGDLLTRHMLRARNKRLHELLAPVSEYTRKRGICLDMEVLLPSAAHHGVHTKILNSLDVEVPAETEFHVFDAVTLSEWQAGVAAKFTDRMARYVEAVHEIRLLVAKQKRSPRFVAVEQRHLKDADAARAMFQEALALGYEGIMLRNPGGGYKQGRCGHKGAWLLKFKAEETEDGQIVEVVQQLKMRDGVERTRNAFGRLEQPTKNAQNYAPTDSVGSFKVRNEKGQVSEITFAEGVADTAQRKRWWRDRASLVGLWVEYKCYPGGKDGIRSGRMTKFRPDKARTTADFVRHSIPLTEEP